MPDSSQTRVWEGWSRAIISCTPVCGCRKGCTSGGVMYLVFTRMPGESHRRRLWSLLVCLCDVFRALINSLVCLFYGCRVGFLMRNSFKSKSTSGKLLRDKVERIWAFSSTYIPSWTDVQTQLHVRQATGERLRMTCRTSANCTAGRVERVEFAGEFGPRRVPQWLEQTGVQIQTHKRLNKWSADLGAGIAQWLEHRTRDWKVAGSNPCWNGGRIFFSRVDFQCWLLFRYPFHPRVTAVARKKSRSFCQKCRWQVTAKHAYTLRMWILLNRASALVTTCP